MISDQHMAYPLLRADVVETLDGKLLDETAPVLMGYRARYVAGGNAVVEDDDELLRIVELEDLAPDVR